MISSPCKTCRSSGLERKTIKKKVQIPGGVDVGTQIRLSGEGGPGTFGGPSGSLFLLLDVKPHQFFKRRENDILLNLDINVAQAVLGADVLVPTLDGDEKLKIPAGTQPGKIFHLKGKGVPHVRNKNQRGEQMVMVNVAIPSKLTREQRELFEKLAESLGTTVKPQEKGFLDWLNDAFGG
jgi:molecular chaperone DnaJ